ncbi:hypothetical protein [Mangrovicoccus ximenensis]|uniref:hypothetical protein n=1 Tax=Mangrovicoccus ximenensis TaxID=1911570 RepID=UPI0011AE55F4|nr:hypothetical protein [Mangrovicoccus ximenensis]
MQSFVLGLAAACAVPVCSQPAISAEETLRFRLVVHHIETDTMRNPAETGPELSASHSVGVAVMEDGRLAWKEFVWIGFGGDGAVPSQGFSSYVFENGDGLDVRFSSGPGEGGYFVDYEVLSGSGGYAGATGTGQLKLVPTDWDHATLFEGSIDVTTP